MSAPAVLRAGRPDGPRLWSATSMLAALSAVLSILMSAPIQTAGTLLIVAAASVIAAAVCTRRRRQRREIAWQPPPAPAIREHRPPGVGVLATDTPRRTGKAAAPTPGADPPTAAAATGDHKLAVTRQQR